MPEEKKLTPPDKEQCQRMFVNGSFMSFGKPQQVRCKEKPTVIVTEREPNPSDGQRGSMSLCHACWKHMQEAMGTDFADAEPI